MLGLQPNDPARSTRPRSNAPASQPPANHPATPEPASGFRLAPRHTRRRLLGRPGPARGLHLVAGGTTRGGLTSPASPARRALTSPTTAATRAHQVTAAGQVAAEAVTVGPVVAVMVTEGVVGPVAARTMMPPIGFFMIMLPVRCSWMQTL